MRVGEFSKATVALIWERDAGKCAWSIESSFGAAEALERKS